MESSSRQHISYARSAERPNMSKIPTFGFSAFLKLLNLNAAPQRSEKRKRYKPSEEGYDYHKSLRKRIQWLATGTHSMPAVLATLGQIRRKPERNSAERALKKFEEWRAAHPAALLPSIAIKMASPNGVYNVHFSADFVAELGQRQTAIHVWNTQLKLSRNITLALLTQVASAWPLSQTRPQDFAVLSLQTGEIFRWSDALHEHAELGSALLTHIERLCEIAASEVEGHIAEDRPSPSLN